MIRIYLNDIGAPEGSWSLDDGDPKTELNFEVVEIFGHWKCRRSSEPKAGEPKAWLESQDATSIAGALNPDGSATEFRHETGMVER